MALVPCWSHPTQPYIFLSIAAKNWDLLIRGYDCLSIFVEDLGTTTNQRGQPAAISQDPCSNWASAWSREQPFPSAGSALVSCIPINSQPSQIHMLLAEPGWWQGAQACRDRPSPLLVSHDISRHKKCQSTGDWFNNGDLVFSLKIKIMCLQITCSLNNIEQNILE